MMASYWILKPNQWSVRPRFDIVDIIYDNSHKKIRLAFELYWFHYKRFGPYFYITLLGLHIAHYNAGDSYFLP